MKTLNDLVKEYEHIRKKLKYEDIVITIRNNVIGYIYSNNIRSLVVGISGGLDSAIVACLCQEEFTGIPLYGLSIPIQSDTQHKILAKRIGEKYCSKFMEFDLLDREFICNLVRTLSYTTNMIDDPDFSYSKLSPLLTGNVKARLRMITLYDLARKTNGLVLSTDNRSEYQMGFWTICGDVGDLAPIQFLGKGYEIPELAKYLNIDDDVINQAPSDGLGVTSTNTDEAQLGATYKEIDVIMHHYFYETGIDIAEVEPKEKISKIIKRYENTEFKRKGTIFINPFWER